MSNSKIAYVIPKQDEISVYTNESNRVIIESHEHLNSDNFITVTCHALPALIAALQHLQKELEQ